MSWKLCLVGGTVIVTDVDCNIASGVKASQGPGLGTGREMCGETGWLSQKGPSSWKHRTMIANNKDTGIQAELESCLDDVLPTTHCMTRHRV